MGIAWRVAANSGVLGRDIRDVVPQILWRHGGTLCSRPLDESWRFLANALEFGAQTFVFCDGCSESESSNGFNALALLRLLDALLPRDAVDE